MNLRIVYPIGLILAFLPLISLSEGSATGIGALSASPGGVRSDTSPEKWVNAGTTPDAQIASASGQAGSSEPTGVVTFPDQNLEQAVREAIARDIVVVAVNLLVLLAPQSRGIRSR